MKWWEVLKIALELLDKEKENVPFTEWVWGGGSVLAYRYKHRDSEDVDIFLWNAQLLALFSPRLNENLESMSIRYNEMSHFIKLWIKENAQIDFILAPSLTSSPFTTEEVMGYKIQVETPWEISIKKLFYRSYDLKVRDVIDVVAVLRHEKDRKILFEYSNLLSSRVEEIKDRLKDLRREWEKGVEKLEVYDESLKEVSIINELEEFLSVIDLYRNNELKP